MNHRTLFAVAALISVGIAASPALAQSGASRMAEKMRDPAMQETMAAAVRAISEAMLEIPLAPFVKAAEAVDPKAARDIDPDATLRDYAGPEAERMPEEMSRRLPAVMGAMGEMAGGLEQMLPVLKSMARDMEARIEGAARGPGARAPEIDDDIPSAQPE